MKSRIRISPDIKPLVAIGGAGNSAQVDYNSQSGYLTLVIAGSPDVDNFGVNYANAATDASLQQNIGTGWQTIAASAQYGQFTWAKISEGDAGAALAPGSYEFAQLAPNMNSNVFGAGGVTFFNAQGTAFTDSVVVVPEPSGLALLAATGLLVFGAGVVRRRRNRGNNPQG